MNKQMDKTTAMGLWTFGFDFFKAGELLIDHDKAEAKLKLATKPGLPDVRDDLDRMYVQRMGEEKIFYSVYYLYCHAIELGFKAFLRTKGSTSDQLANSKIGHKLEVLLEMSSDNGLDESVLKDEHIEAINLIAPYYGGKEFEYIKRGSKELWEIVDLRNAAESLLKGIKLPVSLDNKKNRKLS